MAERKARPKETKFVSEVAKDPNAPVEVTLLRGFLGKASKEGHSRLYGDALLGSYVEIPGDAIRYVQEQDPSPSVPLGGAFVWVDQDAELSHGPVAETHEEEKANTEQGESNMFTIPPYCAPAAQAQGGFPTIPASQCLSVNIVCCGLGAQNAAQPQTVFPTLPPVCLPTFLPPTCLPPVCGAQGVQATGAQAQAGFPTIPASQCLSVNIVCCGAAAAQAPAAQAYAAPAAQGAIPTIPASQCASVPIVCC